MEQPVVWLTDGALIVEESETSRASPEQQASFLSTLNQSLLLSLVKASCSCERLCEATLQAIWVVYAVESASPSPETCAPCEFVVFAWWAPASSTHLLKSVSFLPSVPFLSQFCTMCLLWTCAENAWSQVSSQAVSHTQPLQAACVLFLSLTALQLKAGQQLWAGPAYQPRRPAPSCLRFSGAV